MAGAASGARSELQGADQGHHQQGVGGHDHDVRRWPRPRVLHHHARAWKKQGTGKGRLWGGADTPGNLREVGFVGFFVEKQGRGKGWMWDSAATAGNLREVRFVGFCGKMEQGRDGCGVAWTPQGI